MTIRLASPEEAEAAWNVQKAAWLDAYPDPDFGITRSDIEALTRLVVEVEDRIGQLRRTIENPNARMWLAFDDDKLIGTCAATRREVDNYLGTMYVLPGYQGQGIGSQLMSRALEWLGDKKPIVLSVVKHNRPAIRFYHKFGFEGGEQDWSMKLPSGATIADIAMTRPAASPVILSDRREPKDL